MTTGTKNRGRSSVQGVHLTAGHWNDISENTSRWFDYNKDKQEYSEWEDLRSDIITTLTRIMSQKLTLRQSMVIDLYYGQELTQQKTANRLGIKQPTVHQHLNGKKRKGKVVGGVFKRIDKIIREIAKNQNLGKSEREIGVIMKSIIDPDITHRQSQMLIKKYLQNKQS